MNKMPPEEILGKIKQIPTFPEHVAALVDAINSSRTSASDIADMIERDPALATNLLKIANSAFYGFLGNVTTIREAVVLIGLREVKNLVLGTSILRFFSKTENTGFNRTDLWRHSVVCAFLTRMLAREAFLVDQEGVIMIGGLIHDIGKVILDQYFPESFPLILRKVRDEGLTFSQAEKAVLGYNHYQIGATLLKRWNFPDELIASVFYHHAPWRDVRFTAISATIYLANILSKRLGFPSYEQEAPFDMSRLASPSILEFLEKNGFPSTPRELESFLRLAEARLKLESSALFQVVSLAA